MKVFLIDDNPVALTMLSHALNKAGYETLTSNNGIEALIRIPVERPDAIVLDVMMPEIDGFETARQLRTNPVTRHIPILLLTAKDQVEDVVVGLEAGADDYVIKPVMPAELIARVKALIRRSASYSIEEHPSRGRVLSFWGVKGGVGVTTLSVNIAVALTQLKKNVILADFHPWSPAAALHLGISQPPSNALSDQEPEEITRSMLEQCLSHHFSGVHLLTLPCRQRPLTGELATRQIAGILEQLRRMAELIVLDVGNGLTRTAMAALSQSDQVIWVVDPDPIALSLAQLGRAWYNEVNLQQPMWAVPVYRSTALPVWSYREAESQLGVPVLDVLTTSAAEHLLAAQTAIPLVLGQPDTASAAQLRRLAQTLWDMSVRI